MLRNFRRFRRKDLREACREAYGDDFVELYDIVNSGGTIGTFVETAAFLKMVSDVKEELYGKNK